MINNQILASRFFMLFVMPFFFLIPIPYPYIIISLMFMVGIHRKMTPVIFTKRHSLNLPQPVQEATCVDSQKLLTPS